MPDYKNFVNPYNFIPLDKKPNHARPIQEEYTGVIEYSLLTKTRLFIPDSENDHAIYSEEKLRNEGVNKDHKSYSFFAYSNTNDQEKNERIPVIPGSEMRGMLRSNYEILTNSCLSILDKDITISKRTAETFKAGLLKKTDNGYELYEAEDCLARTKGADSLKDDWDSRDNRSNEYYERKCYVQENLKEGQQVYFEYIKRSRGKALAQSISMQKFTGAKIGYVVKGEDGPKMDTAHLKQQKHCLHIFKAPDYQNLVDSNANIEILEKCLKTYESNAKNDKNDKKYIPYKEYRDEFHAFRKSEIGTYFPVYYSKVKEQLYLAPACITREIYDLSEEDLVGEYKQCTNRENLCPTCRLFGTLNINKNWAVASKVRVTDLHFVDAAEKELYDKPVTLDELSSPKLSNIEFYRKKPDGAVFWTYEYYIDANGNLHMFDKEATEVQINGRKVYWHQADRKLISSERTKRNITIEPLKTGAVFKGKLFFEHISKDELDMLIYLLNTGEDIDKKGISGLDLTDKKHGYKLGTGKPLGLGSVATRVDAVKCHGYEKTVDEQGNDIIITKNTDYMAYDKPELYVNEEFFNKVTCFDTTKGMTVSYPKVKENDEGFEWFTKNHAAYRYVKKDGINKPNNSPNARNQQYYVNYLEPMELQVQKVAEVREIFSENGATVATAGNVPKCKSCGKPVKVNKSTGKYFDYCWDCSQKYRKSKPQK